MKTILHIIPTFEGGGAERQLSMLVAEQVRTGASVHVGLRRLGVHSTRAVNAGAHLHELGDYKSLDPRLLRSLLRLIGHVRPSIVQTWLPQSDVMAGIAALVTRVPWIMTERSSPALEPSYSVEHLLRHQLARLSSAIVANSQAGAGFWKAVYTRGPMIAVVPNAIDLGAIRACVVEGAKSGGDDLVLSVGRLVASKGHEVVVEAWSQVEHAGVTLHIIGDGPMRSVIQLLAGRTKGKDVELLPFNRDWWRELHRTLVLVSMSHYEGSPNVVLEAMAAGVPLVVSDIPEHREILDETCALLVPVGDSLAAARAIGSCLTDRLAAQTRAATALRRVNGLTIAAAAGAYEEVYSRVLKG